MIKKLGDLTLKEFEKIKKICHKTRRCEGCPLNNKACYKYNLTETLRKHLNDKIEVQDD